MSFRNGDKSRENRLRKAREKMRVKVRGIKTIQVSKPEAAGKKSAKH